MKYVLMVLQVLLAFAFIAAGGSKLFTPADQLAQQMNWVNFVPAFAVVLIGILEVARWAWSRFAVVDRHSARPGTLGRDRIDIDHDRGGDYPYRHRRSVWRIDSIYRVGCALRLCRLRPDQFVTPCLPNAGIGVDRLSPRMDRRGEMATMKTLNM